METTEGTKAGSVMQVVSAAVIRVDDGVKRMLLAQRKTGGSYPLAWCTPGGKIDGGEEALYALKRELYEELGIPFNSTEDLLEDGWFELFRHEGTSSTTGRTYEVTCYTVTGGEALRDLHPGDGIEGLGWFTAEEVEALTLAPADTANRAKLAEVIR